MLTDNYVYYVTTEEGYPKEKPLGVFRAPGGKLLEIEAFRRDLKWHYSGDLMVNVMIGEIDIEEVTREEAQIAINNIFGIK
jgi:hypothetical protein